MDKLYKILFIVVIALTLFIVGYTFNRTVIKSDFVMINDKETTNQEISNSENQTRNIIDSQSTDKTGSLDIN
jgi:hypothetical protein